ncbi:MAG TPA: ABC transporter ATP-binding protein [Pyrinomonadaceae bacterium]|jgi:ABC-2 type transport system ATP-binding protein|nr:ABC transporter ATP-binding protein [Pyrinomonadaceae bacterium]
MTDTALQTEQLTKRFGARIAVDRLTLRVDRSDIYGFLGPNGAGKSTTLRMLLGLVRPSSGVIKFPVRGSDWEYLRARSRVGAIIETPAFYENFSGRRNLQLLASLSGGVSKKRIEEVLEIVELRDRARDPVKVYSYGMRQRLGIAQALLPTPDLIILDEPTNGLDPQGIQQTRNLIRRLRDEFKLTVLLSSHLLTEIEQLCNRVGIINEGRLLYEGEPDALVSPTSLYKIRVDDLSRAFELLTKESAVTVSRNGTSFLHLDTDAESIPAVNALLVANGIKVYELSPAQETLEEAFLRLTKTAASHGASSQKSEVERQRREI